MLNVSLRDVEDPEYKPAPALFKDDMEVTHFHFVIQLFLYSFGQMCLNLDGEEQVKA